MLSKVKEEKKEENKEKEINKEEEILDIINALLQPKNYAVIIGCSEKDSMNCKLFQETLEKIETGKKWELQSFTTPLGKENLLEKLAETLKPVTLADSLIVYISASNSVLLSSGNCQVDYFGWNITDSVFYKLFSAINPASFTLILQCDYAATPFWLDTNKAGYALFTASSAQITRDIADISLFTQTFCEVLSLHQWKISHRQLHIETITR